MGAMIRMDFDSFKSDIQTNGWNVYGVEVYENGEHVAYPLSAKGLEGAIDNEVEIR